MAILVLLQHDVDKKFCAFMFPYISQMLYAQILDSRSKNMRALLLNISEIHEPGHI